MKNIRRVQAICTVIFAIGFLCAACLVEKEIIDYRLFASVGAMILGGSGLALMEKVLWS